MTLQAVIGSYRVAEKKDCPFKTATLFSHTGRVLNPESLHTLLLRIKRKKFSRIAKWSRNLLEHGRWFPATILTTTWKQSVRTSVVGAKFRGGNILILIVINFIVSSFHNSFFNVLIKKRLYIWHISWHLALCRCGICNPAGGQPDQAQFNSDDGRRRDYMPEVSEHLQNHRNQVQTQRTFWWDDRRRQKDQG